MVEIVDEDGNINYDQALEDLKVFLYGRKGEVDTHLHIRDLLFYVKPRNLLFTLRSFSFAIIPKVLKLWKDLGYRTLQRYIDLNVIALFNKLKQQARRRGDNSE